MAQRVTPVDESRKDEDGVIEAPTVIMGTSHSTYWKVECVDDVDVRVGEGVETIRFSYPEEVPLHEDADDEEKVTGTTWVVNHREIDLGKANRDKLLKSLKPFIDSSREMTVRSAAAVKRRSTSTSDGPDPEKVRPWARSMGHDVKDRGRIPEKITEAYVKANPNWRSE